MTPPLDEPVKLIYLSSSTPLRDHRFRSRDEFCNDEMQIEISPIASLNVQREWESIYAEKPLENRQTSARNEEVIKLMISSQTFAIFSAWNFLFHSRQIRFFYALFSQSHEVTSILFLTSYSDHQRKVIHDWSQANSRERS